MARVSVDFTDVEAGGEILPEGVYRAVVESVERKTSQNSGEPMIEVHYKVTEGTQKGNIAYEFLSLQKQALFRLKTRLQALGFEIPSGPIQFDTDDMVGLPVRLQMGAPRKSPSSDRMLSNVMAVTLDEGEAAEVEVDEEAPPEPQVTTARRRPGPAAAAATPAKRLNLKTL